METLKLMLDILYVDWFVILFALYMASAPFLLMRKTIPNAKSFFRKLLISIIAVLFLFYFVIPVPLSVQEKRVRSVHNLIENNKQAIKLNMQYWLSNQCESKNIKAYQFFMFEKAYQKDSEATFKLQKGLSFVAEQDGEEGSKMRRLCDLKL